MNNNNLIFALKNNPWLIFAVTSVGVTLSCLDAGIVNVALPTITEQFVASKILLSQWVLSGYLFVVCITLPLWGKLGDMYSRNKLYLIGFAVFTVSSFFCGIASSIYQLIFFRCIQGLGGAMIMANNQAIIISTIPKEKHGTALGLNAMLGSAGFIVGPGLGGLILTFFDWRSIFYINVPIGIVGCILGYKILPKETQKIFSKIDLLGALLFAIGMYLSLTLLTDLGEVNFPTKTAVFYLVTTLLSWAIFYRWEKRTQHPLIDFALFDNKRFLFGVIMTFIIAAALGTNGILLPFYLQNQLHLLPAKSGLILLIPALFTIVLAPISGYLADRIQQNFISRVGLSLVALSLIYQFFLTQHSHLAHVIVSQSLMGIGFGAFQVPNNHIMLTNVPSKNISIGSSIASLMRNMGRIFGTISATAAFAIAQNNYLAHNQDKMAGFFYGFKAAFLVVIILLAIGIGVSWKHVEQDRNEAQRKNDDGESSRT